MRLLLTGASSQLGAYLLHELARHRFEVTAWSGSHTGSLFGVSLQPVDLADRQRVAVAFAEARPEAVIHCAALSTLADCYRQPQRARLINVEGTALLAELASQTTARMLLISTDLVFDGQQGNYREADPPAPLSVYGRTKADAEQAVLTVPGNVVVRSSLFFGPSLCGRPYFFDEQLAALRQQRPLTLFEDEWRTPLSLATAARALVALVQSDFPGLVHLGGPERLSRLEMGRRLAEYLSVDSTVIVPSLRERAQGAEPRPRDTSLDSGLWRTRFPEQPWPRWHEALAEMLP